MVKRIVDLFLSSIGLCLLTPVFLILGFFIKFGSKGPVFYSQDRVGKNGKLFKLLKFRTMHVGADKLQTITVGTRDPRITRIGYYLRKLKLDELPQLINVVKGDMSLVGPRPELKRFVDLYSAEELRVISIRPGITDFASIKFRNENELLEGKKNPIDYYVKEIMPVKLQLNLDYLRNQSLLLDLKIIFMTLFSIFKKT